jgi:hypothetical protein
MTIKQAREEYNELLERYHNANEYYNDPSKSLADKEKNLKNYKIIISGLGKLLLKVGPYDVKEVLGGMLI